MKSLMALWDLAGKKFAVPVYKLMGAYRDKIKIYASSNATTLQGYLDQIDSCKQHGVMAYKIHPGGRNAQKPGLGFEMDWEALGEPVSVM